MKKARFIFGATLAAIVLAGLDMNAILAQPLSGLLPARPFIALGAAVMLVYMSHVRWSDLVSKVRTITAPKPDGGSRRSPKKLWVHWDWGWRIEYRFPEGGRKQEPPAWLRHWMFLPALGLVLLGLLRAGMGLALLTPNTLGWSAGWSGLREPLAWLALAVIVVVILRWHGLPFRLVRNR